MIRRNLPWIGFVDHNSVVVADNPVPGRDRHAPKGHRDVDLSLLALGSGNWMGTQCLNAQLVQCRNLLDVPDASVNHQALPITGNAIGGHHVAQEGPTFGSAPVHHNHFSRAIDILGQVLDHRVVLVALDGHDLAPKVGLAAVIGKAEIRIDDPNRVDTGVTDVGGGRKGHRRTCCCREIELLLEKRCCCCIFCCCWWCNFLKSQNSGKLRRFVVAILRPLSR
mmetsp:Transcript_20571/g.42356  ORF Transcript_20571/g.42356 Transcript_20571/m.42356 type:complete len:223 (+) Transcript_20571:3-671(+)